jgi:hypothetical protein
MEFLSTRHLNKDTPQTFHFQDIKSISLVILYRIALKPY